MSHKFYQAISEIWDARCDEHYDYSFFGTWRRVLGHTQLPLALTAREI